MPLFLHIGYPKTSTTYLQNYFFDKLNINFLGKKNNKVWLNSKKRLKFNEIVNNLKKNKNFLIPDSKTLVSAEGLIGNIWIDDFYNFRALEKILKHKKTKIIITIRRQTSIFYSIYKQYLWEGGKKSYQEFFRTSFFKNKREFNINCLNYYELFKKLNKRYIKNNFIILPCEMLNKDNFKQFNKILCKFLDIKEKNLIYHEKLIRSGYNPNEQFYVRLSNKILNKKLNVHDNNLENYGILDKILNLRGYFLKIAKLESFFFKREVKELKKIENQIYKYFKISNMRLSKKIKLDLGQFKYY